MYRTDLHGRTFGRLKVLKYEGQNKYRHSTWRCKCSCGVYCTVVGNSLMLGLTQSCGCLHQEVRAVAGLSMGKKFGSTNIRLAHIVNVKHGHCKGKRKGDTSSTYTSWNSMLDRCTNPRTQWWKNYGGATPPVRVCRRWKSFENFLADMGPRPAGTSLSRLADSGDYKPGNVVWGTRAHQAEQQRLKKRLREGTE
jgi:hypothetical protein